MPKQIACGHCGRSHPSVAEVRSCALGDDQSAPATDAPPSASAPPPAQPTPPDEPALRRPKRPAAASSRSSGAAARSRTSGSPTPSPPPSAIGTSQPLPTAFTPERLAGPVGLGRSVLLDPEAPVPEPWSDATELVAGPEVDDELVSRLLAAWRRRERLIVRWTGPRPQAEDRLDVPFDQLSPRSEIPGERLAFALSANTVDLLDGEHRFEPLARALALGAPPADAGSDASSSTAGAGDGDVVVDGRPVWVDGGPLTAHDGADLGGLDVVPRVQLVAGVLRAVAPGAVAATAELAPDQLQAVQHDGGPARIIAPAGSGKTRVLTERTRHLLAERGLAPPTVALVAYNRRARGEMAERLADQPSLTIRTLNSLALGIATGRAPFVADARAQGLETIGELDARRLLERLVPGKRRRQLTDPLEPWIDALSACRLGLRDPEEVEAAYGADVTGFAEVLPNYRAALAERNLVDFDEQILAAIQRLLTDPVARAAARRATPVLMIDEFQDLTPAHLLLVRLLAGPAAEVFAVGDDDQTIYGYSGASPEWLVDFDRYFPGAADHRLTVNYRCPPTVIDAAVNLLSHNRVRVTKTIAPGPDRRTEADSLVLNATVDPQAALVQRVDELRQVGVAAGDIAVLARVNAALLPAVVHLAEAGHPVARPLSIDRRVLERSGLAAALAWLRLAAAPEQRLASDDLRLALRRPPRSLHPRIVDWVCEQSSVKNLRALSERLNSERDADNVASLADDIEALRISHEKGSLPSELLDEVFHTIGLLGAASQLDQSQRTARRAAHADELAGLRAVADLCDDPARLEPWLLERLDRLPSINEAIDAGEDVITLATIHTTKGLEWDHVIVHDVRADLHPHRLATDTEEERRIFHVALTRCRHSVVVNAGPLGGSPFLAQMATARPADEPWPEEEAPALVLSTGAPRKKGGSGAKKERSAAGSPEEEARRAALTEWRLERCRTDGVPAYVVIDNATLDAIAAAAPVDLAQLGRIKGIGPTKLDRYGADILGVIGSD
ncbi:MAG: ATP-dependent DNA helicase UvrD2 [Actinomycetota bacterium]